MLVVGDGIRSAFVIQGTVRASSSRSSSSSSSPSSSSSIAAAATTSLAIVKDGGLSVKKGVGVRGRIVVDVKCRAHQEVVGIIPTAERKQLHVVPGVKELERSNGRDDDELLVLPPLPAGIAAPRFESAAHQLEISLHDVRLLSRQSKSTSELLSSPEEGGDGRNDDDDDDNPSPSRSASGAHEEEDHIPDETSNVTTPLTQPQPSRPKKMWRGVRRQRRKPPQPPWSEDDFTQRTKLMLESILFEFESIATEEGNENHRQSCPRVVVEDVLNSWLGKITRVELTRLIKDLGFRRQPSLGKEVFFWMQRQRGRLKPSAHVYSAILGMLGRAGMVSEAWEIFNSEQVKSLQSVHIFNSMMGAYLKCGNFQRAWELYEDLCALGLEADEITFNTLLSGISRAGSEMAFKAATAEKLLCKMKLAGIPPGRYTYNTLIMVFSQCGNLEGAASLLEEMRAANQTPDLYTYNTVIGMYGRAGKYKKALQIYDVLRAAGLHPDVVTYTHLMQMFSRAQDLEAAIEQFSEMRRVGCTPDLMTYSLMVHIYGKAGLTVEAEQAFRRMQEAGFKPNIVTWSSLIQAFGKEGMLEKVSSYFAEMLKSGCQPDASLFNIMMTAYRQAELPTHAASLFRKMKSRGIEPNAACFNTLIHAFSQSGQREDAKAWHEQMVRSGFAPDKLSRRLLNNLSPSRRKYNRDTRRSEKKLHSIQLVGVPPPLENKSSTDSFTQM